MIIIIKGLDGSQASGLQRLADEINTGAFGKHGGNKHDTIGEAGGIPASLPCAELRDFPQESPAARQPARITPGTQVPSPGGLSPPRWEGRQQPASKDDRHTETPGPTWKTRCPNSLSPALNAEEQIPPTLLWGSRGKSGAAFQATHPHRNLPR